MSKKTKDNLLRIKLFDLVKVKCNFHYCRSGKHKHAALRIRDADTQRTICRRLKFYAVLEIVIYEGLESDQQGSWKPWLQTSRAESYCITKLNHKYCTSEHESKLGMHWSLRISESLFQDRVSE